MLQLLETYINNPTLNFDLPYNKEYIPSKRGYPYTYNDDLILINMIKKKHIINDIAIKMERSIGAIQSRIKTLINLLLLHLESDYFNNLDKKKPGKNMELLYNIKLDNNNKPYIKSTSPSKIEERIKRIETKNKPTNQLERVNTIKTDNENKIILLERQIKELNNENKQMKVFYDLTIELLKKDMELMKKDMELMKKDMELMKKL